MFAAGDNRANGPDYKQIGRFLRQFRKAPMNLVIVESPAKAKTINKYLGSSYKVIASFGHVRDLPSKDGAVEPDNDFAMHWEVDQTRKAMKDIQDAMKSADKLILATDPDREGEAISWHILQVLNQKKLIKKGMTVERVAFNAITKQAILKAMAEPRQIDGPLVDAYLARRALDYLVGFNLSRVLWRRLPGARSAGRVQSVALRLICDREAEIEAFKTDEYWTIEATLATAKNEDVKARLQAIGGKALQRLDIKDQASAHAIKAAVEGQKFVISGVEKKAVKRNPYAPFTTSTLQQEASSKLGFGAKQTMQVAQRLYEGVDIGGETAGLITYMRTDGVDIIPEAVADIRRLIETDYSKRYVAPFVREYKTKAKNAQEAHEAIRPTDVRRTPKQMAKFLAPDQMKLYDLIWKRTVASQMASAEMEQTTADIGVTGRDGKPYSFRATGSTVQFEGFLKLYDVAVENEDDENSRRLPALAQGDAMSAKKIEPEQHFTKPPPRFTEASLVKRMEELGIGRPSTYASTLAVLVEREYVRLDKKQLIPEDKGRLVTAFLENFFRQYVEYDFTAGLEEKLDLVSDDKLAYKELLRDFWSEFAAAIAGTTELRITDVLNALNDALALHIFPDKGDGSDPRACPKCGIGRLSLKPSRTSGAFIGCERYPECSYSRPFGTGGDDGAAALDGKVLGNDPETGLDVILKNGRFGPYVQLGEPESKEDKPKRSSLPKGVDAASIDFDLALKLLRLPREVGMHPETNTMIEANLGKFGPYIKHDGTYANVESIEDVFTIGVNRAVTVLAEKRAGGGKSRFQRAAAQVLKELGEHPRDGGPIKVLAGKYGPYVSHNGTNATVPKAKDPALLTADEAVALLDERIASGGGKTKTARKAPAKKAAAAKAPAKKAAAKKAAPKKKAAKTGTED
jgi:DNA topoisomerase I